MAVKEFNCISEISAYLNLSWITK